MMTWKRIRAVVGFGTVSLLYVLWLRDCSEASTTLADATSQSTCADHGWQDFSPAWPSTRRKVYDLVMVNDELDWLEVRLNSTYEFIDYFIVVEADKSFTGLDKPLHMHDHMHEFSAYADKIIYHRLQDPADFSPSQTWDRERLQRNAMFSQVFSQLQGDQAPTAGDVLVVADVDEMVRPETLGVLRRCRFPRRLTLRSRFYYYSFQYRHVGPEWAHPQATFYDGERTVLPADLRNDGPFLWPWRAAWWQQGSLANAGWHCSSCFGTVDELLNKMRSFSHEDMNRERFRDRDRIVDRVRSGKDLWDREGELFERIDNNTDVPAFLRRFPDKYPYVLSRDGPSAGFSDYRHG